MRRWAGPCRHTASPILAKPIGVLAVTSRFQLGVAGDFFQGRADLGLELFLRGPVGQVVYGHVAALDVCDLLEDVFFFPLGIAGGRLDLLDGGGNLLVPIPIVCLCVVAQPRPDGRDPRHVSALEKQKPVCVARRVVTERA